LGNAIILEIRERVVSIVSDFTFAVVLHGSGGQVVEQVHVSVLIGDNNVGILHALFGESNRSQSGTYCWMIEE
jgi:hypothetical protein